MGKDMKIHWKEWRPERFPQKTLREVLSEAPRVAPDKIPWQVRLLENPESKWAFPGAISLFRHDCIHALLCASFHPLDEAYVIGFTMGTDRRTRWWHYYLFKFLTSFFYPKYYKFKKHDLAEFSKGYKLARRSPVSNLADFPFEEYQDKTLGELRKILGISWFETEEQYKEWSKRWGFYQFCVNDEGRLTTWLRTKDEEAKHNLKL